jgi:tetratricopeptide (TPR) repeat protein
LKEQARSFEQNEQWEKALDLYNKDIDLLSEQDTPDIALFNRSGDLATKIGSDAQAVAFYERAVDYYMDAGLPNNAIAVCKKVMRNLPDRYSIHLKMGQIRAAQGFITDARTSFVTYAGKVQAAGDIDEAFRALIEFVSLAPDDHEACMVLAAQLEQNGRTDEALSQYIGAYRIMSRQGLGALAEQVAAQIRTIDPDLDLENAASDEVFDRESKSRRAAARSKGGRPHDEADEPEIIGPIDLPLMSFDDEDDDEVPVPTLDAPEAEDSPEATAWEALEEEVEVEVEVEVAEANLPSTDEPGFVNAHTPPEERHNGPAWRNGRCTYEKDGDFIGYWYAGAEMPGRQGETIQVKMGVNVRKDYPGLHNDFDKRAKVRCIVKRGDSIKLAAAPILVPPDKYWVPLYHGDIVEEAPEESLVAVR